MRARQAMLQRHDLDTGNPLLAHQNVSISHNEASRKHAWSGTAVCLHTSV
jgi:hypothetical protein